MRNLKYKKLRRRLCEEYLERTEKYWDGPGKVRNTPKSEAAGERKLRAKQEGEVIFDIIHRNIHSQGKRTTELLHIPRTYKEESRYDFLEYKDPNGNIIIKSRNGRHYSWMTIPNGTPLERFFCGKSHELLSVAYAMIFKHCPQAVIIPNYI